MAMRLPLQQLQIDLRAALGESKLGEYFEYTCQELGQGDTWNAILRAQANEPSAAIITKHDTEYMDDKRYITVGAIKTELPRVVFITPDAVLALVREHMRIKKLAQELLDHMKLKKLDQ